MTFSFSKFFKNKLPHKERGKEEKSILLLFNTQTQKKEEFTPLNPRIVKMYNCGPTVYDYQHIGNLRAYIFADILKRTLIYNNYTVKQVINITDVGHLTSDADIGEDKMEKGAFRAGVSPKKLASLITDSWKKDLNKLNVHTETITFTRATDFIKEQIALIETLEEKGYAYKISDGVYYDTSLFPSYGALGNIDIKSLKEGARVEINKEKKNPTDFALWKFSPNKNSKRQQEWDSPWGVGFPGWHLECTAMVFSELGKQIDIHTGGIEHISIHHNNEIAQAEAVTKKQYVKYWLHNAFITMDGKKISKSAGNGILLRQLEEKGITPLAYRYWVLTGHYQSPMNFTWEALEGAQVAFSRLLRIFVDELGTKNGEIDKEYKKRFHERINDNLDTPGALAILWELTKDSSIDKKDKRITLLDFDKVLGLGLIEGHRKLKTILTGIEKKLSISETPLDIRELVEERETARKNKDWEKADEVREKIKSAGYIVSDTPDGPLVKQK